MDKKLKELILNNKDIIDYIFKKSLKRIEKEIEGYTLTPREAKVLYLRIDHTLEEVGKQFDVTRERVRQIQTKALRKLQPPTRSKKLQSFLDELKKENN